MSTIIITGAGASHADGAPLQADLFRDFFALARRDTALTAVASELEQFFRVGFGVEVDRSSSSWPTFEEALGILDLAIARDEAVGSVTYRTNVGGGDLRHLRRNLILAMASTIAATPRPGVTYHERLVANLRDAHMLDDITFITTNYDTILDEAIEAAAVAVDRGTGSVVDYGFRGLNPPLGGPNVEERAFNCLKIHGSLNWLNCPACDTLSITYGTEGVTRLVSEPEGARCLECEALRTPVIVPPSFYKNMANVYLATVWTRASQSLHRAKHLVICGYSMPDADTHVKYLIKRAQLNRDVDVRPLRVTLVNHFPGKSSVDVQAEAERFSRFLGPATVTDSGLGFEEFADAPSKLLN